MSRTYKIEVEIDLNEVKRAATERAISIAVDSYFEARDIDSWQDRENVKKKRVSGMIKQADWTKLPEEMQRGILGSFIEKYILRGSP